jgi:hypothetical protein
MRDIMRQAAVPALLSGLACMLLGGFTGCSLGLLRPVETLVDLLLGAVVGLLLGASALLLRQARQKGQDTPGARLRRRLLYAGGWVAASVLCFVVASIRLNQAGAYASPPAPLPLDRASEARIEFTPAYSEVYTVLLALKPGLPAREMDDIAGSWNGVGDPPARTHARPVVEWTVTGAGPERVLRMWDRPPWSGETVEIQIGQFEAEAGSRCIVTARVVKPSPTLGPVEARLAVGPHFVTRHRLITPAMFVMTGGMLGGMLALLLLGWTLWAYADERRAASSLR